MYMCMYIYACECVCVLWLCCDSYLDMFVIFFHQDTPFPILKQPMGMCRFFFVFFFFLQRSVTGRWPPCGLN